MSRAISTAPAPAGAAEPGPSAEIDDGLVVRMRVVMWRISRRTMQRSAVGLSATELSVLVTLRTRGPCRLGELAAGEGIAAPSMTRVAAAMEHRGLVRRTPDPDDGRSVRIDLTEDGLAALEAERRERTQMIGRRLAALSPEEIRTLVAALPVLERLAADENDPALLGGGRRG